jgi:hypothetical protein
MPPDAWDYQVSFDEGRTFKTADRATGPWAQNGKFITFSDVPPGTRKALVRFAGTQKNTLVLFRLRVDADYREPKGGFRPIRVTYAWEENGQEKKDVRVMTSPSETYSIRCATKPAMKSIVLERAD